MSLTKQFVVALLSVATTATALAQDKNVDREVECISHLTMVKKYSPQAISDDTRKKAMSYFAERATNKESPETVKSKIAGQVLGFIREMDLVEVNKYKIYDEGRISNEALSKNCVEEYQRALK